MTNKIPQEIENIIINEVIRDERNLGQYARNEIPLSEFIKEAYDKGFQAGQKQSEDAFKEMIEDLLKGFRTQIGYRIIHENNEDRELFSFKQIKLFIEQELLSKLNSKEEKENDA